VARMGDGRGVHRVLVGKPEGERPLGNLGVDGKITLSWTSWRWGSMGRTGFGWLRIGSNGRLL
jgi:hypothetical protein